MPQIISFSSANAFRAWLKKNFQKEEGILLKLYKKNSSVKGITHAEALDEALCFGWIDGLGKTYDSDAWLLKFTPRRSKSIWSKRNIENINRLVKGKKMMPSGLKAVSDAKADGRWAAAYDSPKNMTVPEDFLKLLATHKKAEAFFKTLNKANVYAITWRIQTAKKPETREKRINTILAMLGESKKFH